MDKNTVLSLLAEIKKAEKEFMKESDASEFLEDQLMED